MRQRSCQYGRLPTYDLWFRSRSTLLWVALVAALILAGCGPNASGTRVNASGEDRSVVIGLLTEPGSLNVYLANGGWGAQAIAQATSDPWIAMEAKGNALPRIVTKVPTLANGGVRLQGSGMVLTMPIDPRAKWSDGAPIECLDFAFTWKSVMNTRWAIGSRRGWDQIVGVDCANPKLIIARFKTQYAPFMNLLRTTPLPHHVLAGRNLETADSLLQKVVSGPFHVTHWQRGVQISLKRNTYYWRDSEVNGNVATLQYRFFRGDNARNLQLASGEVDVIQRQLTADADSAASIAPHIRAIHNRSMSVHALGLQVERPALRKVAVRKAIAAAIDRDTIARRVLGPQFAVSESTLVPEQDPWFLATWPTSTYSLEQSEGLMLGAGYTRGSHGWERDGRPFSLTLAVPNDHPIEQRLALIIREQLKRAGFTISVKIQPPQLLYGNTLVAGTYDLVIVDLLDGEDPDQRGLLSCDKAAGYTNPYRYCNDDVTRWLEHAQLTLDPSVRKMLVRSVQQQVAADMPILPLYQDVTETLVSGRIRNVTSTAYTPAAANVADWQVTP